MNNIDQVVECWTDDLHEAAYSTEYIYEMDEGDAYDARED